MALIGYAAVLTWRPGSTELVKSVIRHREDETEGESRKRWRGLILFLLPVFVLLAIINAIHLPKAAYVLWAATFIPIGAVDMGHWEHCKAVVRGRPEDPEIATMNRVARRTGPDYIDTFERWWALATGLVAFVLPWFVFITSISNDSRLAWGVRMVWMALLLGVLLGVVCVIAGRRSRRIGRIGTSIIIGDVVGALLFFVSLSSGSWWATRSSIAMAEQTPARAAVRCTHMPMSGSGHSAPIPAGVVQPAPAPRRSSASPLPVRPIRGYGQLRMW